MSAELLITGGAGFIGTHTTTEAFGRGFAPEVLDNLFVGPQNLAVHAVRPPVHEVDLRDEERLTATIAALRPRRVIHLAALHYIPYCNKHPLEAVEVNLLGTRNLLKALEQYPPECVVFASSAAVYPIAEGPHRENDPIGSTDIYGHTKLLGEELLERFTRRTGVPSQACRFFNVYGAHETQPHLIPAIVSQLAAGQRSLKLGNLEPARDYIHAEDIARAVLDLAVTPLDGFRPFNVGTGLEWTVRDVVNLCGEALGREIAVEQDPERMRPSDRLHLKADHATLTAATGWTPQIGFQEGLARLLETELSP